MMRVNLLGAAAIVATLNAAIAWFEPASAATVSFVCGPGIVCEPSTQESIGGAVLTKDADTVNVIPAVTPTFVCGPGIVCEPSGSNPNIPGTTSVSVNDI